MRIVLEDVHYTYDAGSPFERPALRGVSLSIEPAEILAIAGGTGSGKSTLVQHLNLLLSPASGRVLIDGVDARELRASEVRRKVGVVFQFPEAQLFEATVGGDVAFAPRQLRLSEEEVRDRVRRALEELKIEGLAGRSPFTLSGGEKRRAAIAGVLAMEPEVLVLDEPTAGLDPMTRAELLDIIRRFRDGGRTVVMVSHDLDEVAEVADRVCILKAGKVAASGLPAEVFYADPHAAPATVQVASRLNRLYPEIGEPVTFQQTLESLKRWLEG